MIEEPFAAGSSVIHRIDPRFRVIAAVGFSFAVALCYEFSALTAALAFAAVSVLLCRIRLILVLKRLALVNMFILLNSSSECFPIPGNFEIGRGKTYSSSLPGGTTISPFGFTCSAAIFATVLLFDIPMVAFIWRLFFILFFISLPISLGLLFNLVG